MCPTFVSKDGIWHPAKEKIGLVNRSGKTKTIDGKRIKPGDPYIYEGADRAALFVLYQDKLIAFLDVASHLQWDYYLAF